MRYTNFGSFRDRTAFLNEMRRMETEETFDALATPTSLVVVRGAWTESPAGAVPIQARLLEGSANEEVLT